MSPVFSSWVWSPNHNRHYCCSYDEHGRLLEYHWSGPNAPVSAPGASLGPSNLALPQQNSVAQPDQPRTVQAIPPSQSLSYNQSYSSPEGYTAQQPTQAIPISQPLSPTQSYASQGNYTTQQPNQARNGHNSAYPPTGGYVLWPSRPALSLDVQNSIGGNYPRRLIKTGVDGSETEQLDSRYARVIGGHMEYFFIRGRVFKMLWIEPAGQATLGQTRGSTHFSVVTYGQIAYAEIRRFVVVSNKGNFSQCIPIQTYRKRGATKPGLLVEDHGIIYTGVAGSNPPALLTGEEITKEPIRVESKNGETLDPESRVNFGKPYAVEHNVKIMEIGMVVPEHMHLLEAYFQTAMST